MVNPESRDSQESVIRAWCVEQTAPWLFRKIPYQEALAGFRHLNETESGTFLFTVQGGSVLLEEKPPHARGEFHSLVGNAALLYRSFLEGVASQFCPDLETALAIYLGDGALPDPELPVFAFQKPTGNPSPLLPDVDFLSSNFFDDWQAADKLRYDEKLCSAVFVGSTTGGRISAEDVRSRRLPRIRAGTFFRDSPDVIFALPHIVQCDSEETEALLRAMGFGSGPFVPWEEQLRHRFLISMDGNGATCSRVARSLMSNSALVKYASPHRLYYFSALQPWRHYIPVTWDEEVIRIVRLERERPGLFEPVARAGREFAETYLTRAAVMRYTASLLRLYSQALIDGPGQQLVGMESTASAGSAEVEVLVHVANRGDMRFPDSVWAGEAKSGHLIEGFALQPRSGIALADLAYRAVLHDGSLSPWMSAGEFCGTRGECRPIHGFAVQLRGAAADRFICECAARFVDGTEVNPVSDGVAAVAPSLSPLEAMRIILRPRGERPARPKPTRSADPTPIRALRELTSDHVAVFPAEALNYLNCLAYSNAAETCSEEFHNGLLAATAPTQLRMPEVFIGRYDSDALLLGGDSFWVNTREALVAEQIIPYFAEGLLPFFEADPEAKLKHLRAAITETVEIHEECLLAARFGHGTWGHWTNEILPKAVVAESVFPGRFRFVVPASVTQSGTARSFANALLESLAAYGIPEDRLIRVDAQRNYKFSALFDVGGCSMWNYAHPQICSLMRRQLRQIGPRQRCDLLAIARHNSPRVIHNLDEVNALLDKIGFKYIDPLQLTFQEQVSHFKAAKVIFGVYGSGLSGIIHSPQGIGVVACGPANWGDSYYVPAIQERGGLYADIRGPRCWDGPGFKFNAPFTINPKHVALALEKLLLGKQAARSWPF
jgi:hypothetical protein